MVELKLEYFRVSVEVSIICVAFVSPLKFSDVCVLFDWNRFFCFLLFSDIFSFFNFLFFFDLVFLFLSALWTGKTLVPCILPESSFLM